jgi:hypothetical protein
MRRTLPGSMWVRTTPLSVRSVEDMGANLTAGLCVVVRGNSPRPQRRASTTNFL